LLLILKLDEKEEVQQEKFIDKKEQVEQEWVQIDHQSEKKVELHLVQETL
jgi:hypothetical protein